MSFWKVLLRIHSVVDALDEILDLVETRRENVGTISPEEIIDILRRHRLWPNV